MPSRKDSVRSLDPDETLEGLTELLDELDKASITNPIIVEGIRDKEALQELGVNGQIIVLNDGTSILNTCERLSEKWHMAIILTDWDRKGGQLARMLMDALESCDMKHDTKFRAKLSRLAKKEIKDVESLPGFIKRLKSAVGLESQE
jgi:5S rRNA maturation endonuclease (ribonuclease M5)